MFTGIVKAKGRIESMAPTGGDVRLTVRSDALPWKDYEIGESIAVNGVCLTAVRLDADGFATDVSNETLRVTALGDLGSGSSVNLEPSLTASDRRGEAPQHLRVVARPSGIRSRRLRRRRPVARRGCSLGTLRLRAAGSLCALRGEERVDLHRRRQPYHQ